MSDVEQAATDAAWPLFQLLPDYMQSASDLTARKHLKAFDLCCFNYLIACIAGSSPAYSEPQLMYQSLTPQHGLLPQLPL